MKERGRPSHRLPPKYRRQTFYGEKRRAVGSILRKLCEWKKYEFWKQNAVQSISTCFMRSEIQIQEQGILVPRILRWYGG